ncbi:hypothetical protein ACGYLO_16540 [Sulfitobacter sp. 1A13353]|uniref:hypothetical protein n=1 Tax=Sulfitobacter sp. 1A13353 TaxID=3368568 RepID=UPI0037477174
MKLFIALAIPQIAFYLLTAFILWEPFWLPVLGGWAADERFLLLMLWGVSALIPSGVVLLEWAERQ